MSSRQSPVCGMDVSAPRHARLPCPLPQACDVDDPTARLACAIKLALLLEEQAGDPTNNTDQSKQSLPARLLWVGSACITHNASRIYFVLVRLTCGLACSQVNVPPFTLAHALLQAGRCTKRVRCCRRAWRWRSASAASPCAPPGARATSTCAGSRRRAASPRTQRRRWWRVSCSHQATAARIHMLTGDGVDCWLVAIGTEDRKLIVMFVQVCHQRRL